MKELREILQTALGEKYRFQMKYDRNTFMPFIDVAVLNPFQVKYTISYRYDATHEGVLYDIKEYRTGRILTTVR